jgi:hypothetical protein
MKVKGLSNSEEEKNLTVLFTKLSKIDFAELRARAYRIQ